jgi:D-3-phosphoglycerate dehydrogenase
MHVLGYDPEITVDSAWRLPSSVKKAHSIDEVIKGCDFLTLHVPLNDRTRHLVNARRLAASKRTLVVLNFAREGIVDEEAIVAALGEKKVRAYITDFPNERLKAVPGVMGLPHLGASTAEAEENSAVMVADELRGFLEQGTIRNAVNFPSVEMARESPHRIAIANANVPNMVGQISTTMAQAGLNIHNMVNKSRGEMAYTLVDLDSAAAPEVIQRIARIPGVLSIRSVPDIAHT